MQARLALEHGKRVLLMRDLVTQEDWAQLYVRRGAKELSPRKWRKRRAR